MQGIGEEEKDNLVGKALEGGLSDLHLVPDSLCDFSKVI